MGAARAQTPEALFGLDVGQAETPRRPLSTPRGGVSGVERLVFDQPVTESDKGIGPRLLLAISSSCVFQTTAAEDFTINEASQLTRVEWDGVYFGLLPDWPFPDAGFHLTFYVDNGQGNVGEVIADFPNLHPERTRADRPPIFGANPVYTYSVELPEPVFVSAGARHWISINGRPFDETGPAWGWMVSPVGNAADTPAPDQPLQNRFLNCADLPVTEFDPGSDLDLDADLALRLYAGCVNDCNCNGIDDVEEILLGFSADCNGNGVPDDCDVRAGLASDCDQDGVPDSCQLRSPVALDSGPLGPLRADTEIFYSLGQAPEARSVVTLSFEAEGDLGSQSEYIDASINGVELGRLFLNTGQDCGALSQQTVMMSAEAFNDAINGGPSVIALHPSTGVSTLLCPGSQITVRIEYDALHPRDLNANGTPDECDILSGSSLDCNGDFVPDELQLGQPLVYHSGTLSPVGTGAPNRFDIPVPLPALGSLELEFTGRGDLGSGPENVSVTLNGQSVGVIFEDSPADCWGEPIRDTLVVPGEILNLALASGSAPLRLTAASSVDPALCVAGSFVSITARYMGQGMEDCDANGVFDGCDLAAGDRDLNQNGLLDSCERLGDLNGDDVIDVNDLATLLGLWGSSDARADLNADGKVDSHDLALLLGLFEQLK